MQTASTQTPATSYVMKELIHVCPTPAASHEFFRLQIRSDDGRATKWLNITPEQFKKIEQVLLGIEEEASC